jgi:hypothetical protein
VGAPVSLNGVDREPLDPVVEYTISFELRIVSGARKHGLSRRRIEQALAGHAVAETILSGSTDPKIRFVGLDERGVEIEVVAVVLPGLLLVIHAMPTRFRGRS